MSRGSQVFQWRKAIRASDLPPTDTLVALMMGEHMNADGGSCYPSIRKLARETRLNPATIKRSRDRLKKMGWLVGDGVQVVQTAGGPQAIPRYHAAIPAQPVSQGGRTEYSPSTPKGGAQNALPRGAHSALGGAENRKGGRTGSKRGAHSAPRGSQGGTQGGSQNDTLPLLPDHPALSTDQGNGRHTKPPKPSKPHPAREWARPYHEPWMTRFGGDPDVGFLRKKVEPLERADGRDVTIRRWNHLLAGLTPRFFGNKDPFKTAVLKLVGAPKAYDDPDWHLSDRERAEMVSLGL